MEAETTKTEAKVPLAAEQTQEKSDKPNAPPAIITVDTKGGNNDGADKSAAAEGKTDTASQARTPKHANTVKDGSEGKTDAKKGLFNGPSPSSNTNAPYARGVNANGPAGAGRGAFQPRDRSSYAPVHPNAPQGIQVSPTGNNARFYASPFNNAQPRFTGPYDFTRYDHGPGFQQQGPYRGPPPPMYPPRPFPTNEYQGRPSWGPPPPFGRVQMHTSAAVTNAIGNNTTNTVSRAVSSSFDRSIKSRDEKGHVTETSNMAMAGNDDDHGSVSEDASWKMLNQVHSVDEEEMRKRTSKVALDHPGSNSSSLTNSPTEGIEGKKSNVDQAKITSSLDSLSSVASTQEPMETKGKSLSPSGSTVSLDLMKCPSGSSGLLLPAHQRNLSQFSFPAASDGTNSTSKREHGGAETPVKDSAETRRAPSGEPPSKKGRLEAKDTKKGSPLSITCSPPQSPTHDKSKLSDTKVHQPQPVYPQKDGENSPGYYDQPPTLSYSMDSAHMTRPSSKLAGRQRKSPADGSSTEPPSEGGEMRGATPGVGQLPSWEIHPQDSFGGNSVTGGNSGLMSSFSFPQEYAMLPSANSNDIGVRGRTHSDPALESRNPSFEGGQGYPNSFGRSDSMVSYGERHGPSYESRTAANPGYAAQFPPHAGSWGSASSYPAVPTAPLYGMVRSGFGSMVRNYSEDSGARASPAPGSSNMRSNMLPPTFQPPPEFRAPPSMVSKSAPQNTIITPYQPTPKNGPFGWTKEEDNRLTEIMKKFKNPRDWEPIAKEHNRGRT